MNFFENIKTVWLSIMRNKVRSFLTMLGIIIGIMSVIMIMSVGAGAQSLILNQIKSLGSNLVGVLPGKSDEKGPPASAMGIVVTSLKAADVEAIIKDNSSHLVAATGYVRGNDTVTWDGNKIDTNFVGVSSDYPNVEDALLASGRFFSDDEDKSLGRVAIVGSQVAAELFGQNDPIGKDIKIKKTNFTIIGKMKERGTSGFQNQDNQIFVPLNTAQKILLGIDYVSFARFKVDNADNVNSSMERVREILRSRHDISNPDNDDFSVRSMAQGLDAITNVTNALKMFLTAIAAIALAVGGIGIMNIMLAAVQERTREIGLRKAVGAKNKDIIFQFLTESAMITFIGGVIGIILGALISFIVAKVAIYMGYNWDFVVSLSSIIIATLVSIGVGLIFGIIPARRAARLNPIEALRYE
ncbi:MAG: ABC transporter permease [Candidatus Magasanikbacteria bacterium]|nr:ABC transporter permease [Candidatus Magasanikbacteria bacterium]